MKAIMILGAIVGFLMGMGLGIAADSPWPTTLWHACAAAFVAGLLGRWWSRVLFNGLQEAIEERRAGGRPRTTLPASKPPAKA